MTPKTLTIAAATADVLRRVTVDDCRVVLPPGQLDRATYLDVNKVLAGLGGKWNRSAQAHVFAESPADTLAAALGSGSLVIDKFGYFPTPPAMVDRLLSLADVESHHRVLEPSAGQGAIADRLPGTLTLVELQAQHCEVLRGKGYDPIEGHFLATPLPATFDRVVMNPPFERCQDIEHVTHAYSLLAPGGRLVAVMSAGSLHGTRRVHREFAALLDQRGHSEPNPEGSFKASGTGVHTVTVVLQA